MRVLSEQSWLWHMPGAVAVKKVHHKTPSGQQPLSETAPTSRPGSAATGGSP